MKASRFVCKHDITYYYKYVIILQRFNFNILTVYLQKWAIPTICGHCLSRIFFLKIQFWYLRCCGCPWNWGRQHLATPLKTCHNTEAGFLQGGCSAYPPTQRWRHLRLRRSRKRGIIHLATLTTLPEHQSVDDCRRSLLLPRLKQLVTLRREVIFGFTYS